MGSVKEARKKPRSPRGKLRVFGFPRRAECCRPVKRQDSAPSTDRGRAAPVGQGGKPKNCLLEQNRASSGAISYRLGASALVWLHWRSEFSRHSSERAMR